jgi:hypothetical protein
MTYEKTPIKNPSAKMSKRDAKRISNSELNQFSTMSMVWHIVKRHKTGLLAIWAVTATVAYMFPPAFDMLFGLIGR